MGTISQGKCWNSGSQSALDQQHRQYLGPPVRNEAHPRRAHQKLWGWGPAPVVVQAVQVILLHLKVQICYFGGRVVWDSVD